jgi:hypothetical protein
VNVGGDVPVGVVCGINLPVENGGERITGGCVPVGVPGERASIEIQKVNQLFIELAEMGPTP